MTEIIDRTDATDEELAAQVQRFGMFEAEETVEKVARAMWLASTGQPDCPEWPDRVSEFARGHFRRLAAAAVAALGESRAEGADANGCPDRRHHGVDCPGDACRYAALAPQAER